MKIAVLGAGLTGLTAAYRLSSKGHQISLFEKENFAGGLASGFKNEGWDWPLERFYHHLFAGDKEALRLINELDLKKKLFFQKPQTATYYQGRISPLDSPFALLKFPHLSLFNKLRTGLALSYLKLLTNYKYLEQVTAVEWLTKSMGQEAFEILWKPLLLAKFGKFAPQITAAWFWARIKKRTRSLGYLEGGFQTLADRLMAKTAEMGGKVVLNQPVQKIEKNNSRFSIFNFQFDAVISTLPTPVFLKIAPELPKSYTKELTKTSHLWSQTLILELKNSFLPRVYWLNIHDNSFPFVALVEHTNFVSKSHYNNHSLLYLGNYLPERHPFLRKKPKELLKHFMPYLKKINPTFNFQMSILNCQLFSAPFAQPVITLGYRPPELKTPIKNIYFANMDCVYPWDRGTNYAIELGEMVAKLVNSA